MKFFIKLFGKPKTIRKQTLQKLGELDQMGKKYNLQDIYRTLNQTYFDNQLKLKITWFGSATRKARRYRKLGSYCFEDKLIKIHRLLDQTDFPPYFVSYVVYHEMLHSVYPPLKTRGGRYQIHHDNFKDKEKEFEDYNRVKQWEEKNKRIFFK